MIAANVSGGTGARCKPSPHRDVAKCDCGGFIAQARAEKGATTCLRCDGEAST